MYKAIFRVESRNAWRDTGLRVIVLVLTLLVAYAAFGGARLVAAEKTAIAAARLQQATQQKKLRSELAAIAAGTAATNAADPRNPLQVGRELLPRIAVLPPGPLAAIAVGQRDVLPHTIRLTTKTRLYSTGQDDTSPLRQSNGPFDLAFVFVFLLPLVIIALSYDLLSVERERGTLALVLSQPVSLPNFVLGKAAHRAALLLLVVVVLGLVAALASGASLAASGGALRLVLYLALLAAYTLFWLALAVLINSWGRSSAANALALVGLWLALLVVVPGLASVAVDAIYPSPSRVELVNLARSAAKEAEAKSSALEGDHGKPVTADLGRRSVAMQRALERQVQPVLRQFREQRRRQQSMVDRLRFLSPAIMLNEGLSDVAGSSVARHQHFAAQVDVFHAELKRFFSERIERGKKLDSSDYDAMPQFVYQQPPDAELAGRVGASLAVLLLAAAALLALAIARLKRATVRG